MGQEESREPPIQLSEKVYRQLVESITSGEFADNARLPSEIDLAKRFKVSRPILRQALTRLRSDGLIISRQGSGSFVLRRSNAEILDFGHLRNINDVRKCLEFRRGLESEAASQAALQHAESRIKEIARTIQAMRRAISQGKQGIDEDFAFHLAVAQATENRFFVISLEALRSQILFGINLNRTLSVTPLQQRLTDVEGEHSRILDAIRKADPDGARKAMADHIGKGIERVFE
jgi:DNA-binding FadR family transcriptional regulator